MFRFIRLLSVLALATQLTACAETPFETGRVVSYCLDEISVDGVDDCPEDVTDGDGEYSNDR